VRGRIDNSIPQSRSLSEAEREALFKCLHLAHMRRIQQVAVQAEREDCSYVDFLALLLAEGVAWTSSISRSSRHYVWRFWIPIWGPELISEGRYLILHGKTGGRNTYLAIGYRAIQNGFETHFTTATAPPAR